MQISIHSPELTPAAQTCPGNRLPLAFVACCVKSQTGYLCNLQRRHLPV
uniref:Uncharacterized protein n=1 Tax=Anguilla anguilla TaxID=7936 RepID=A0A0E9TY86_ANGAN